MIPPGPVILVELNELTPRLMFRFIEEGRLPGFRRFYEEARVYTSDAQETGLNLNPWIQWVTVHSGMTREEHGVFLLGEGEKVAGKCLVDVVSEAGLRVWMCGSMNIPFRSPLDGAAMPDPWSTDVPPHPAELGTLYRFVRHHIQEHTNPDGGLGVADHLALLKFLATHGLSSQTLWRIVRQLAAERVAGGSTWKRVGILDDLMGDVFGWYYRKLRPHFSSLFLNSTAHLQHTHWRNLEPERFSLQPTAAEQAEYEDAVLFGYQSHDRILQRMVDLAGDDATIVFCTALSQQPDSHWDDAGGKHFYRPRDFGELVAFAGIDGPHQCSPVMSEEFWVEFEDETAASEGERRLSQLAVDGESAFQVERRGADVYAGCAIYHELPEDAKLLNAETGETRGFFDLLYGADSLKSGVHHPDGLLWIRSPDRGHQVVSEKVPLTSIAPTVLDLLGVDRPDHMRGASLA